MEQLNDKIDRVLSLPPYSQSPDEREAGLLALLKEELEYACQRHAGYENYVRHWPVDYRSAARISDLPFLPVEILKANPPLSFISPGRSQKNLDVERHHVAIAEPGCAGRRNVAAHDQGSRNHRSRLYRAFSPALSGRRYS